jgi:hypothetical protein
MEELREHKNSSCGKLPKPAAGAELSLKDSAPRPQPHCARIPMTPFGELDAHNSAPMKATLMSPDLAALWKQLSVETGSGLTFSDSAPEAGRCAVRSSRARQTRLSVALKNCKDPERNANRRESKLPAEREQLLENP